MVWGSQFLPQGVIAERKAHAPTTAPHRAPRLERRRGFMFESVVIEKTDEASAQTINIVVNRPLPAYVNTKLLVQKVRLFAMAQLLATVLYMAGLTLFLVLLSADLDLELSQRRGACLGKACACACHPHKHTHTQNIWRPRFHCSAALLCTPSQPQ